MADRTAPPTVMHATPPRPPGGPDRFVDTSDHVLVLAVARYDQDALAEIYRRHAGAVGALARRLLVEQSVAEEIAQEVFLRLWDHPTRFDAARGSLRSFLLTETHGRAVDVLRADLARRAREERDTRRTKPATCDIAQEVWDATAAAHVRRSMATLSDVERRAIELAYFDGYTYREVARRLDEPEGTVKSRIRSGLKRLRQELAAAGITTADV